MVERLKTRLLSPTALVGSLFVLSLVCIPAIVLFIVWLSNMETVPVTLWQALLNGQVHTIMMSGDFWLQAFSALDQGVELDMFLYFPALLWTMGGAVLLVLFERNITPSLPAFLLVGTGVLILPYAWGSLFIALSGPAAQKVGPLLAFMVLCPLYCLPLLCAWALRKRRQARRLA